MDSINVEGEIALWMRTQDMKSDCQLLCNWFHNCYSDCHSLVSGGILNLV